MAEFNQTSLINETVSDYYGHHGLITSYGSTSLLNGSLDVVVNGTAGAEVEPAAGAAAYAIPVYYSTLFRWIAASLGAIIFIVGVAGNVLVVLVISQTKFMHTTTNCYLVSLAIADCIVLLSATLPSIPEPFFQIDEWPFGRVMCSILVFLQYVGVNASSLSITAFTVERYIAICFPIRAQTICTLSRAKRIIIVLWIFTTMYCCPWLGLTEIRVDRQVLKNVHKCVFRLKRHSYLVYYMTDLIIFYVIPLILAAVLYCLIARILFINSRISHKFKNNANSKRIHKSRIQVVRMLAVIVLVFATLWMPYRVMVVYNSFASNKYVDLWFLLFSRTMVYANSAINPILYNVMSVKFRRAFRNHILCDAKPM
ncbi:thyrotropin-releasing hormone receptor-like [Gigantopelta aegis]|uniref:thyrotropin-releasing hormone receptor-like n=1 Tax=Gigantopelta aegis TaxID=1735272 RepID=UPI001B88ADE2|nr:thyrotropin-releasing hormone receptor-like [Gigantopelta aegis]